MDIQEIRITPAGRAKITAGFGEKLKKHPVIGGASYGSIARRAALEATPDFARLIGMSGTDQMLLLIGEQCLVDEFAQELIAHGADASSARQYADTFFCYRKTGYWHDGHTCGLCSER